jgi:rubrerythrin
MPEFTNPFIGVVPRKLTNSELARAIRLNIAAEHEAVHIYEAHADATDNEIAKRVLHDVANEEREHIGEFMRLLKILQPDEQSFYDTGTREVEELINSSGSSVIESNSTTGIPSIGDLKNKNS